MTLDELDRATRARATVPIWPTAGQALGYKSQAAAYDAAKKGHIPTIEMGRLRPVPSAILRKMLGLDQPAAA